MPTLRSIPQYVQPPLRTGKTANGMVRDLIGTRVHGVVRTENVVAGTGVDGATLENVGFVRMADGTAVILELEDGDRVMDENGNDWSETVFTTRVTTPYGASNSSHVFFGVELTYDVAGTLTPRAAIVTVNKVSRAVRFTLVSEAVSNTVEVLGLDLARAPEGWGTSSRAAAATSSFAPPGPVYYVSQHLLLVTRNGTGASDRIHMRRLHVVMSGPDPELMPLHAQEADSSSALTLALERVELAAAAYAGPVLTNLAYCGVVEQGYNQSFVTVFSEPDFQTHTTSNAPVAHVMDATTGILLTTSGLELGVTPGESTVVNGALYSQRPGVVALFGNSGDSTNASTSVKPTVWLLNAFTELLEAAPYANGVLVATGLAGYQCVTGSPGTSAYSSGGFMVVAVDLAETPEFPQVFRFSDTVNSEEVLALAPLERSQADVRAAFMGQGATGGVLVGDISFQSGALKASTAVPNSVLSPTNPLIDYTRRLFSVSLYSYNSSVKSQSGITFPTQRVAELASGDAGAANVLLVNGVIQLGGSAGISEPAEGMLRWNATTGTVQVYNGGWGDV